MKLLVNKEIKELTAYGENGIEWTEDLLEGYTIPSYEYDDEKEIHIMSVDDYEWWVSVVDKLNRIEEMKEELSDDELEEYNAEDFNFCDLEVEVEAKYNWCSEKIASRN